MDGSSHPEVFCKIGVFEIPNFTRIIQCFMFRSLKFVYGRFFFLGRGGRGGRGVGQDSGLSSGSSWLFYMLSLDFRNILFSEELSWLFCYCAFFLFIDWVLTCSNT